MRISRWRQMWPRPWLLFLLLGGSVMLAAVLAWSAQRALQGQRKTAERALRDEAAFATFNLASHTGRDVYWGMVDLFAPVTGFDFVTRGDARAPLHTLARDPCEYEFTCTIRDSSRLWFRFDVRDGALAIAYPPERDTVTAHDRSVLAATVSRVLAARRGSASNPPLFAHELRKLDGRPHVVVIVPVREHGATRAVYGFAIDPVVYGRAILFRTVTQRPLLPAFLAGNGAGERPYEYSLTDRAGRVLEQSDRDAFLADGAYSAALPVDSTGGDLVVRLALGTPLVERRLAGALPPMRLASVAVLFLLNAALVTLVIARLRGEYAAARRRADFTAGVSHELRTPLTQIMLFGESLSAGTLRSERERRHAAEVIVREARRLLALIENVLRYARIERDAGRAGADDWVRVSAAAEIREAVAATALTSRERRANVAELLDETATVLVDRALFRHALVNLLDNALRYGPPGQTVTVGCARAGAHVRIWVDDEGPGLTPRDRQRVWEPFVRLEQRPDVAAATGTGLGLAVVRYIAVQLGGRAWAEVAPSTRGARSGARFVLELPAAVPSSPASDVNDDPASDSRPAARRAGALPSS